MKWSRTNGFKLSDSLITGAVLVLCWTSQLCADEAQQRLPPDKEQIILLNQIRSIQNLLVPSDSIKTTTALNKTGSHLFSVLWINISRCSAASDIQNFRLESKTQREEKTWFRFRLLGWTRQTASPESDYLGEVLFPGVQPPHSCCFCFCRSVSNSDPKASLWSRFQATCSHNVPKCMI